MSENKTLRPKLYGDGTDACMVNRMRLLLAVSCLLMLFIDPEVMGKKNDYTAMVFGCYLVHSMLLSAIAHRTPSPQIVCWLDIGWFYMIILVTGGSSSFFYLFFFFAILTASFIEGFDAGARITLASSLLFATTMFMVKTEAALLRVALHTTFLLALGYMVAHWGGRVVSQRRNLALLHDVSKQSNPRFGVDHTIGSVLEKIRVFYDGSSCIFLMQHADAGTWSMRVASAANAGRRLHAAPLRSEVAARLLAFDGQRVVLHTRPRWSLLRRAEESCEYMADQRWRRIPNTDGGRLADLLDCRSLISVPVPLRNGVGRLIVATARKELSRNETLFLLHIAGQAFPVIENIDLLDRMASEAVLRERERISRDLHDTTIQPYIGLRHGVAALRKMAEPGNVLIPDLDNLLLMTAHVIGDLRRYAHHFRKGQALSEPELMLALRRQATQLKEFYGIDIAVCSEGQLDFSDRLAAEVFQIASEGMSNIRKHTNARSGRVAIACQRGVLTVRIENACMPVAVTDFRPGSLFERAEALGGQAQVLAGKNNDTSVQIVIPV